MWRREVSTTAHDKCPLAFVVVFNSCSNVFFYTVHFHGGQVVAIGQGVKAIAVAINAGKLFGIAVPWSNVFVPNGPINTMAIFGIGFKI